MDENEDLQLRIQELILKLQNEDRDVQRNAAKELVTIGMFAVPDLIKTVKSYKYLAEARCHSVTILDNIAVDNPGNPILKQFISTFMTALGDVDWRVRQASVEALTKIGNPAIPALIDALDDRHLEVRGNAAEALGKIGDSSAVPALVEALKYNDEVKFWEVKKAAQALENILGACKTNKEVLEFESKLQEGYGKLRKMQSKGDLTNTCKVVAELKTTAAKRKSELADDKGILLSNIPKPPKRGKIYSSIRKKVRNS
jgi:HEAT repeat protein